MKTAVVAGGAGFIGSHLSRELERSGWSVHVLARATTTTWRLRALGVRACTHRLDFSKTDLIIGLLDSIRPTAVFDLTNPPRSLTDGGDIASAEANALRTTTALVSASAATAARRIVHFGSSLEYANRDGPTDEHTPLEPATAAGAMKRVCSEAAMAMGRELGVEVTVLRPFYVYGPLQDRSKLVPTLVRGALEGRPVQLTPPGFAHDFVFVGDVVEATLRAAESSEGAYEAFNIGSARQCTNEEVAGLVETLVGKKLLVLDTSLEPRPHDRKIWIADTTKARRILGWKPRWRLEDGIAEVFRWEAYERGGE